MNKNKKTNETAGVPYFDTYILEKIFSQKWYEDYVGIQGRGHKNNWWNFFHDWNFSYISTINTDQRKHVKYAISRLYEFNAGFSLDAMIKQKMAKKLRRYNAPKSGSSEVKPFSLFNYLNDIKDTSGATGIDFVPELDKYKIGSLLRTPFTITALAIIMAVAVVVVECLRFIFGPVYYGLIQKTSLTEYLKFGVLMPVYRVLNKVIWGSVDLVLGLTVGLFALHSVLTANSSYNKLVAEYKKAEKAENVEIEQRILKRIADENTAKPIVHAYNTSIKETVGKRNSSSGRELSDERVMSSRTTNSSRTSINRI